MDLSHKFEGQSEGEFSNGVKGIIGHIGYDHSMLIRSRQIDVVVTGLPEIDQLQLGCGEECIGIKAVSSYSYHFRILYPLHELIEDEGTES